MYFNRQTVNTEGFVCKGILEPHLSPLQRRGLQKEGSINNILKSPFLWRGLGEAHEIRN
jgi:hypothetical protein